MNVNWFLNRCRRRRQDLYLLAGGVLPETERDEIERHLAECDGCRRHYAQIKGVAVSLAEYRESLGGLEPTQAARRDWARAIRTAGKSEGDGRGKTVNSPGGWWREVFRPHRQAWAGIAALWLVMWLVNWGRSGSDVGARTDSTPASAMTQSFDEQRRLLAVLIQPAEAEPADAPRRQLPPHSARQRPWLIG
jgi:anti-sigma factor RsiW